MLLAGVLSTAIMADFWQPQKTTEKRIDQILTSASYPRQNKHTDIKKLHTTMSSHFKAMLMLPQLIVVFLRLNLENTWP